jgi:YVTN family beta-propeller protein
VDIFYDLTGVFVANMLSNTITRADINGIVSDFTITGGTLNDPYDLTSSAVDANYLYVTNSEGDNVFRINTGTRHVDTITNLKP